MEKKERISLYIALVAIGVVLTMILFPGFKPKKQYLLPMEKALSFYQQGDYQQAMIYFAQADNADIPEASFALGVMHFSGRGTRVNIPKALNYYKKAAENGYAPAQTTLALLYMEGTSVDRDTEKAVEWAKKAAENNDTEAQIMLARWFENGEHIERDIKQAVHFYEMAAKNGDINAKMALSVIYKKGNGSVLSNPYAAKRWEDSIQGQKKYENIFQNRPADYIEKALP
ncbi:MAG: sel1 repeat family protein [Alphaproteobacteria bacterium]|nr:sel1 repeat family protein [Alphaproteobacteria bacterium]